MIPDLEILTGQSGSDPDKRDYLISNEKIEGVGWMPSVTLKDGIRELIKGYKIIINNDSSHFRNSFPLGYSIGDR